MQPPGLGLRQGSPLNLTEEGGEPAIGLEQAASGHSQQASRLDYHHTMGRHWATGGSKGGKLASLNSSESVYRRPQVPLGSEAGLGHTEPDAARSDGAEPSSKH